MGKIIACLDGSNHSKSVCNLSAWVKKRTDLDITLLHVAVPHDGVTTKGNLSGSIGFGTQGQILENLTAQDEAHGKMEQQKGQRVIDNAKSILEQSNIKEVNVSHQRGSLKEIICELESQGDLVIMGKSGEDSPVDKIGSTLENVIRSVKSSLLVTIPNSKEIKDFIIAYDGTKKSLKMVESAANNKLLKNLQCHLIYAAKENKDTQESLEKALEILTETGFEVKASLIDGDARDSVPQYLKNNNIDLLVMGAYCHSKIRTLILGSTTTALISRSNAPILLIH